MFASKSFSSTHPVLQIKDTRVLWEGNILKHKEGKLRNRYLVIANTGIFFFKKKAFKKSYILSKAISYEQLTKISLISTGLYIEWNNSHIIIEDQRIVDICSIIYTVRETMFHGQSISFTISPELRKTIEETVYI